jgi:hypothetical protein
VEVGSSREALCVSGTILLVIYTCKESYLHSIQPSTDVGFKILVGAPLFCPLDGQTKGGVVVGTTLPFVT